MVHGIKGAWSFDSTISNCFAKECYVEIQGMNYIQCHIKVDIITSLQSEIDGEFFQFQSSKSTSMWM